LRGASQNNSKKRLFLGGSGECTRGVSGVRRSSSKEVMKKEVPFQYHKKKTNRNDEREKVLYRFLVCLAERQKT